MAGTRINISDMASTIMKELQNYRDVSFTAAEEASLAVAKDAVKELRRTAPRSKNGGDYAKSWAQKKDPNEKGPYKAKRIVYARDPEYRIAHLLEKPHQIVDKKGVSHGTSKEQPHIAAAEKHAEEKLFQKLTKELGG